MLNFKSLKTKITGFSVTILVASIVFIGSINLFAISKEMDRQIQSQAFQLVNSYATTINHWLESKQRVISSLKPIVHGYEQDIFNQLVVSSNGGGFDQTFIGYPDKSHIFSAVRDRPGYDPTSRPWYKGSVAVGGPFVSAPYIGASTGKMLITIADLVGSSSQVEAVVAGDVMMEDVLAVTADIKPTPSSFGFLLSSNGTLLSYPDKDWALKPLADIDPGLTMAALAQQGLSAVLRERDVLLFNQPVKNSDWTLVVAVDKKESRQIMGTLIRDYIINTVIAGIVSIVLLSWIINIILKRLEGIRKAINSAGSGDFSRKITIQNQDELGEIANAYNKFTDDISSTLTKIKETSYFVRNASSEIAAGNQDLANRTEHLANTLSNTMVSVESLTRNVMSNTESAKEANTLVNNASVIVDRGGKVMSEVVEMMGHINQSSQRIGSIIGVIDSIAFQTNLLALNAAVEAARAGEQGRGFAVVASEVRSLAQRSADAAKEISSLISESVANVNTGTQMVENAGATMQEIVQSIQHISGIMSEVLQASQSQNEEINLINTTITSIESNTQQNTALVEESAAAASSLYDQASALSESVDVFTLPGSPQSSGGLASRSAPPTGGSMVAMAEAAKPF